MNQGSWTNAEKRFVRDNAGKLTVEEMACRIGRTSSAVKMFLIRNRIAVGTQIKRNILQEILKIKFVHPEYFKPTRAFYKAVGMSQIHFWDLYYGRVQITEPEYVAITTHLEITLQEAFEARQLNLFEGEITDEQNKNSIDKVKAAVDIVDVISSFVRLEKKGPGYVGVCPFHNDRHPSMRVTPSRQIYKCFVCGAGGDVFDFLIRHENMSFTEAVLWCARRAGIQVEETEVTKEELEVRKHRETLYITMDAATNFFQSQLPSATRHRVTRLIPISLHPDI